MERSFLNCTVLHCTALHCTALHFTALHCTVLHCTALQCTVLHYTAMYCTTVHFTALHCTLKQFYKHAITQQNETEAYDRPALCSFQCTVYTTHSRLNTSHCTLHAVHCVAKQYTEYNAHHCTGTLKHTPFNTVQAFLRPHLECRKNCHILSTELNTKHSQLLNIIMFPYCPAVKAIQRINSSSIDLPGFVIQNVWQTLASPGSAKYLYGAVMPKR